MGCETKIVTWVKSAWALIPSSEPHEEGFKGLFPTETQSYPTCHLSAGGAL